jgi:hypothetical protein
MIGGMRVHYENVQSLKYHRRYEQDDTKLGGKCVCVDTDNVFGSSISLDPSDFRDKNKSLAIPD